MQKLSCVCQAHRGDMGTHCLLQLSSCRTVCAVVTEKKDMISCLAPTDSVEPQHRSAIYSVLSPLSTSLYT